MPIEYMFYFICREQCIKISSLRKKCGLFISVLKKNIPNNTTPTFQEVGGVTEPLTFCRWHKNFSWYRVNHHNSDLYSQGNFLLATVSNRDEPERQLVAKITLSHGKIIGVIFPLFVFTKFRLVPIQRA